MTSTSDTYNGYWVIPGGLSGRDLALTSHPIQRWG